MSDGNITYFINEYYILPYIIRILLWRCLLFDNIHIIDSTIYSKKAYVNLTKWKLFSRAN